MAQWRASRKVAGVRGGELDKKASWTSCFRSVDILCFTPSLKFSITLLTNRPRTITKTDLAASPLSSKCKHPRKS